MSKKSTILVSILFVAGCLASYRIGIHLTQGAYSDGVEEIQAMQSFRHMKRYEEIAACMEQQKHKEAKIKIANAVITEHEVLASHLKNGSSPELTTYIEARYHVSIDDLRNYKSSRGRSWSEPKCK